MGIRIGICSECGEMTNVEEPCCNAPVEFEGDLIEPEPKEDH